MIDTQTAPIAQTYRAKIEWDIEGSREFDGMTRWEIYDHIRETITANLMEMGFDSWSDVKDSIEITESKEKI